MFSFLIGGAMRYIVGGVGLALAAWIITLTVKLDKRTDERDLAVAQYQSEKVKHAVSLASIAELDRMIDAKNAESDKRAAEYVTQAVADREAVRAADERYKATQSRMAYIDGVVKSRVGKTDCPVPTGLAKALEGL